MGKAVEITRLEASAAELREHAAKSRDGQVVRRLLALALVLEGASREAAATQSGMDRQTLRDWVHRYNAGGVPGLISRTGGGPTPVLNEEQMAELKAMVIEGPDLAADRVVRWRCIDLVRKIACRWSVRLHERTVGKLLRRLGQTRLQPRPFHPKKDAAAQEAFKANFAELARAALPPSIIGTLLEIWFQDEARVGQKGTLTYVWAPKGSRPAMVRDNRHDSVHLFGAICPERAVGAAVIMPAVNTEAMNEHLKEISAQVARGAHALLICDGAGWHQRGERLVVPENITLLHLPPYAPELNPVENVWEYLRGNVLSGVVWDTYDAIVEACRLAWNFLMDDPDRIRTLSAKTRVWASVSA